MINILWPLRIFTWYIAMHLYKNSTFYFYNRFLEMKLYHILTLISGENGFPKELRLSHDLASEVWRTVQCSVDISRKNRQMMSKDCAMELWVRYFRQQPNKVFVTGTFTAIFFFFLVSVLEVRAMVHLSAILQHVLRLKTCIKRGAWVAQSAGHPPKLRSWSHS